MTQPSSQAFLRVLEKTLWTAAAADLFTRDQHPNMRANFVIANPLFNIKEWWDRQLEGDARWKYGTPPQGNVNFAWVQHMLLHLAASGSIALLLANGSMSSNSSGEGDIRPNLTVKIKR